MTPEKLDAIFPWFVFFYGVVVTFVLNQESLMKMAEQRMNQVLLQNLENHRMIAFVCLFVGGAWTLQNIWVGA